MKKISLKFLRLALSCGIGMNLIPNVQLFANTEEPTDVLELNSEEDNEKEKEREKKKEAKETSEAPAVTAENGSSEENESASAQESDETKSSTEVSNQETESENFDSSKENDEPKSDVLDSSADKEDESITNKEENGEEQKPEESLEPSEINKPEEEQKPATETKPAETAQPSQSQNSTVSQVTIPGKTETSTKTETKKEEKKVEATINYNANSWYHPSTVAAKGYTGNLKKSMKLDDFKTSNLTNFLGNGNPFMVGQCTWFAWARFYQVYGFDSGARGNGKTNASEIVRAHSDKFELSSTPAAGATFSVEKNTLMPQYGHVGFIEAFDGEYMWISEGNVMFNGVGGNIWVHKVRWADYKKAYPDIVFAIPKKGVFNLEDGKDTQSKEERFVIKKHKTKRLSRVEKNSPKYSTLGATFQIEK